MDTVPSHAPAVLALGLPVGPEWICILLFFLAIGGGTVVAVLLARRRGDAAAQGFPLVPPLPDGPGRFRVAGVRRDTRQDVVWVCEADSSANARVKAELEGIVVTDVRRE
ncbi:MAG TPA: hypothetical protein VF796_01545 [Humisphaera sp.]